MMAGSLCGIARRDTLMGPMTELREAPVSREHGVAYDLRGQPGPRQVSILLRRDWLEVCMELRTKLPWTVRRANLLLAGIELPIYSYEPCWICIGKEVVIAINGEMAPCWRMEAVQPGLSAALAMEWRCGRVGNVINPGHIQLDDPVEVLHDLAGINT